MEKLCNQITKSTTVAASKKKYHPSCSDDADQDDACYNDGDNR